MANFSTNQVRQLYVAAASKDSALAVTANGDIAVLSNKNGDLYFVYKNADGIVTRSDTITAKKVEYYNKKTAAELARPLLAHTLALDTTAVTLADIVGDELTLTVKVGEYISYDPDDSVSVVASVTVTEGMDATAFHKALALALAKALPKKEYPYFRVFSSGTEVTASSTDADVTGSADGIVVVATPQKWIRGKMSCDPFKLSFAFRYRPDNTEEIAWGTEIVAASTIVGYESIPAAYELADLEYFTKGMRGDIYRGSTWPNNYEPTYMIDPSKADEYDIITIQYYYSGNAEDIQKSPKTIHVAGPAAVITALFGKIDAVINPPAAVGA